MRLENSRARSVSAAIALVVAGVFLTGSVVAAVRAQSSLGAVSQVGRGKHPKRSQVGILIDRSHPGPHIFCFSYSLTTKARIRGSIEVNIDLIDADGVRRLVTLENVAIETFDTASPGPEDDPCRPSPEEGLDVNFGIAAECRSISAGLRKGDIVRWKARFTNVARLRGPFAAATSVGQVVTTPEAGGFAAHEAETLLFGQPLQSLGEDF